MRAELAAEPSGCRAAGAPTVRRWVVSAEKPVRYEVALCPRLLDPDDATLARAGTSAPHAGQRRLVVIDECAYGLFGHEVGQVLTAQKVHHKFCVLKTHEQVKTMDLVFEVVSAMDQFGVLRRSEPVIAIGGGVLSDIVGFATSVYRRSTPYIRVPTTLIGMVDAAIGAKTGVNHGGHKNRLGSYHPSDETLVHLGFLRTLERRHLSNGLAEILKISLTLDGELFELLAGKGRRIIAGPSSARSGNCSPAATPRPYSG